MMDRSVKRRVARARLALLDEVLRYNRRMKRAWVALVLTAASCGSHDHVGGGDDQQTCPCDAPMEPQDAPPDPDAPPDAPPVMATMQVDTTGGTLTTTDGVKLVIPAGALAANTTITIRQLTNNLPNMALGPVYSLEPDGTQFAVPVELTLPYDPAKLGAMPVTDIAVGWNDQGQLHGAGWSVINPTDHTVSALIEHFSQWSVFPAPSGGCTVNYSCMKQCSGASVPDLCCSAQRSTCRSTLSTSFPRYVNCYTQCTGAAQMTNFGNSTCMSNCCTSAGWTHLSHGACYSASGTQTQANAILACAQQCPATGDRGTFCGPITFSACEWNWDSSPNMGDECDGPNSGGVNSQILLTGLPTVADQIWGNPQVIHVTSGSYNSTSLTVSTSCASAVAASGTMSGTWNGAAFAGTWSFGDGQTTNTGTFTVAPRWPQN
jgi:hypothetical protein